MPLTKKLRQTYLDRAKNELGLKGGIVVDDNFFLYPASNVTSYMTRNGYHQSFTRIGGKLIYYWIIKSFDVPQVYLVGDYSLYTQMKIEGHYIVKDYDPCFIHFITEEQSEFLQLFLIGKIELAPVTEWNELVKHELEHIDKVKEVKTRKNKVALDVDGEIRFSELTSYFKFKTVYHLKSQLQIRNSFYNRKPDWVFKIKPVYIDDAGDPVYNRSEFEKCYEQYKANPNLCTFKP